jgi:hypothetical protein
VIEVIRHWGPVLFVAGWFGVIVWGLWFCPLKEHLKNKTVTTYNRVKTVVLFVIVFSVLLGFLMNQMDWIVALFIAAVTVPFIAGALDGA